MRPPEQDRQGAGPDTATIPIMSPVATAEAPPIDEALVIGDSYRVLRVESLAMLAPYAREWPSAVAEYHRRAYQDVGPPVPVPTVPQVRLGLEAMAEHPDAGLWLGLTASYRLVGFLAVSTGPDWWGTRWAIIEAAYVWPKRLPMAPIEAAHLWPKKIDLGVFPAMIRAAEAWARSRGALVLAFETLRDRPRALGRLGFTPVHQAWAKSLTG